MNVDSKIACTIPELVFAGATQFAERTALEAPGESISYAQLPDRVLAITRALMASGIQTGDRVSVWSPNSTDWVLVALAVHCAGGLLVPINTRMKGNEAADILERSGSRIAFVVGDFLDVNYPAMLAPHRPATLEQVVVLGEAQGEDQIALVDFIKTGAAVPLDDARERAQSIRAEDLSDLLFTSGTTGKPKGVVLTHAALIDRAKVIERMEGLTDKEDVLAYLPPAWIGQNMFSYTQCLATGFTVNHPESPSTVAIDMHDIGPTYYFSPPRVLEELLTQVTIRMEDAGKFKQWLYRKCMNLAKRVGTRILDKESVGALDRLKYKIGDFLIYAPLRNALGMSRVRVAYTAGEAIGPDLFVFYRSIGINLKQLYGSTETSVFVCVQQDGRVFPDTVGPPVEGVEIRVAENGEVQVKSPGLFKEYHQKPEDTAESFTEDGWYHTGDAGFLDTHGELKIIDRAKDVGKLLDGRLFAPKYVENKLKFFPFIKEAVAFGANKEYVTAFINIDLEAVANWAERRGLAYAGYADLASRPEVYDLIADCIKQVNEDVAQDKQLEGLQIHRFLILHKELDPDDDELTRTRKVRRNFIAEKYKVLIDALFEGKTSQFIETQVKYEDGRIGKISADLRIAPVPVFTTSSSKEAA